MNHIKNTNNDLTWCGEQSDYEFYFKDIEQAAINGLYGERSICGHCVDAIIRCLQSKRENTEND